MPIQHCICLSILFQVIETMSYNENVSKFMSLLGPFYEVVTTEEMDQLYEKSMFITLRNLFFLFSCFHLSFLLTNYFLLILFEIKHEYIW